MGGSRLQDQLRTETRNTLINVMLGLMTATVGGVLLNRFPVLGAYSALIGVVLVGAVGYLLARIYLQNRMRMQRLEAGSASGTKPAVLLANLVGDNGDVRQLEIDRQIRRAFKGQIEVLVWPDQILEGFGDRKKRESSIRDEAEKWLEQTKCHVLVYGAVAGTGAVHLSLFSKSKDVEEIKGIAGEILDLREDFSDQIAQHIAAQITNLAIDESGQLLSPSQLDALVVIIDELLPSVKTPAARHSLLSTKGSVLFQKGRRATGINDLSKALDEFLNAQRTVDPIELEHLWNHAQLNLANCKFQIGLRTGDRKTLSDALNDYEVDASNYNGNRCEHCRRQATSRSLNARVEILKKYWDPENWRESMETARQVSDSSTDRGLDEYWNLRAIVLQLLSLGIRNVADLDSLVELAKSYAADACSIPNEISISTKVNFLGIAGVVLHEIFYRFHDDQSGRDAVRIFREKLSFLSREDQPAQWAEVQINICFTLRELGKRQYGAATLRDAATTGEDALDLLDKEENSLEWARAGNTLGGVYEYLARPARSADLFRLACEYYAEAALIYAKARLRDSWAMCRLNLAVAQACLAEIEYREARTPEQRKLASDCFVSAERSAERIGQFYVAQNIVTDITLLQANLSQIYAKHGWTTGELAYLEKAIASCRYGLEFVSPESHLASWGRLTFNLANHLFDLGSVRENRILLDEARTVIAQFIDKMPDNGHDNTMIRARDMQTILQTAP